MASKIDICNYALKRCGGNTIISLSDNTESGRLANLYYDQTRRELLREFQWAFAKKRANLTLLTSTPVMDYDYEFQLPSDCLRVLFLNQKRDNYEIEGRKLLSDNNQASILYISDVEEEGQFDPLFVKALSYNLATKFSWALHQEQGVYQQLQQEYEAIILPIAKTISSQESRRRNRLPRQSDWINSRYVGVYSTEEI